MVFVLYEACSCRYEVLWPHFCPPFGQTFKSNIRDNSFQLLELYVQRSLSPHISAQDTIKAILSPDLNSLSAS